MAEVILHASRLSARAAPRVGPEQILHPRSVAVFGASEDKDTFGGRIAHFLVRHGFQGDVYPITPRRAEVLGRTAYPTITDAPAPADVAILAVPPAALVKSVAEAADAGVGTCVIITTGFAEASEQGAAWQAELVEIARRTGIRLVGPNCMGLIVPHHRMALCPSVALDTDTLRDSPIALVSQSGASMVSIFDRAAADGIGFRHCVSVGNQADLELCDFIEYFVEDPGTEAICVDVEGFLDGPRFRRAASGARAANKPLIVVKTGRTDAGAASARSHTASLAGSYDVFAAVCRENRVVSALDADDMVRAAHFLIRHRKVRRGGVGIISSSGGSAAIACDRLTESGLRLATLSAATRGHLGELLLPMHADNPVDLGARKRPEDGEMIGDAARILFSDADVAYGMAILTSMPFFAQRSRVIGEAAQAADKPVMIVFTPGAAADASRQALREIGQFYFDRFEDALRVCRLIAEHDALRTEPLPAWTRPLGISHDTPADDDVRRLLIAYGITFAHEVHAPTAETIGEAAARVGFPVVLKILSREIVHKSEVGGVRLDLRTADEVTRAAREMAAALGRTRLEGFAVQETIDGHAEVIVGARRDPHFGPVVMVGLGGVAVEIIKDVALAPAPVTAERAHAMIRSLKTAPLFMGARGRDPLDVDAIVDAVVRISWLAVDLGPRLADLEVNPLIVRRVGEGAVAVDARGTVRDERKEAPRT
jgi:acetyl-CoA synthetase (ADP-forming)